MLTLLLTGCLLGTGDKNDGEGVHCVDTPTDVGMDESTPLGFAPAEVLPLADGQHGATFTWDDGSPETIATITVTPGTTARYVESVADYPDTGAVPAIYVECNNRVEIDATETFATADGAFDEAWSYVLTALDVSAVTFAGDIPDATFHGSYVLADHTDVTDYDGLRARVDASFKADEISGTLSGDAWGEDECEEGDPCTAWDQSIPIGSWASLPPE